MIDQALVMIATELNNYIDRLNQEPVSSSLNRVVVDNLVSQDGSIPHQNNNMIVLTMLQIEPQYAAKATNSVQSYGSDSIKQSPSLSINISLLFSALFDHYNESLKAISQVISFFQSNSVFNHQNTPDLDPRINRLTLHMQTTHANELSHLWGMIGAKYLPSVIYTMRMLTFDQGQIQDQRPLISEVHQKEAIKSL